MHHVIITIEGINVNNDSTVQDFIATAGYKGAEKRVDDCTIKIDIGSIESRKAAGISDKEISTMVGDIVMYTSCKVSTTPYTEVNKVVKANQMVAGDRFMHNDLEMVLCYDAYYPDCNGTDVALIFKEVDTHISQSMRVHGQSAMILL